MSVPEIQAEELKQRLDKGENLFLLDVRDEYEYEISNIGGHLIPLAELPKRFKELNVRQEIVAVLEQHHGLSGGLQSERSVIPGADLRERHLGPEHLVGGIEEAELEAGEVEAFERDIELGFGDKALLYGVGEGEVGAAAVGVCSGFNAGDCGGVLVGRGVVGLGFEEIVDRAAVGGDEALEVPVAAEDGLEEHLVGAGGVVIDGAVRMAEM